MTTPGTRVSAVDGSWALAPEAPFTPPSVYPAAWHISMLQSPEGRNLYRTASFTESDFIQEFNGNRLPAEALAKIQQHFANRGTHGPGWFKVRVQSPGRAEPLYGVMVFSSVPASAEALAQRVWRVAVPAEYVTAANGGLVSMVYQPFQYRSADGKAGEAASWVLWMSDVPLW